MTAREALDRTLRLMRDEVPETVSDVELLAALTGTRVALIADQANISSHAAQTAFVTAAILMARSGHRVHLICPAIAMIGPQPPLGQGDLLSELVRVGADLIPGIEFDTRPPTGEVDVAIALGNSGVAVKASRLIRMNASPWAGRISTEAAAWDAEWWPLGAMVAATLAATEVFKVAVRKFAAVSQNPNRMQSVFGPIITFTYALAPEGTPYPRDLGALDCISGGAIITAVLFALGRLPGVNGRVRIVEPDEAEITNLNRYMLLLRSHLHERKVHDIARVFAASDLIIQPVPKRYEDAELPHLLPLAPTVLVGVDDIPTRWRVQRAAPKWLAVGATTHWSAMASFHDMRSGCAECLHPSDDPTDAPIPTVAFVSFWAGLLTAAYLVRHATGIETPLDEQHVYLTALRPDTPIHSVVGHRDGCATCAMLAKPLLGNTA
jgi:hypothetical protein